VVVTITGILATLATYSVRERVYEAHSIEAISMLGSIRSGLMAKADDLSGNSGNTLQIGGRVGGFGGPLGLPGVLGKKKDDAASSGSGSSGSGSSSSGNGNGNGNNGGGIDGDGNNGHGNNDSGCDPDNPGNGGNCDGDDSGNSGNGNGNGNGNNGGGIDGDGNNGHGNNDDGCDPDNPGNSGNNCGGDTNSSDDDGESDDSGGASNVDGSNSLCTSASPVPSSLQSVQGQLYQSRPNDWSGTATGGWRCLSVTMSAAQRFQYGYDVGSSAVPTGDAPTGADETLAAWARGDLDGDGRTSWYVLNGASFDGHVVMAPAITMIDQGE